MEGKARYSGFLCHRLGFPFLDSIHTPRSDRSGWMPLEAGASRPCGVMTPGSVAVDASKRSIFESGFVCRVRGHGVGVMLSFDPLAGRSEARIHPDRSKG